MKFKMLSGDVNWSVYGGKFVSKRLNNGNWDYWLVINVINWEESLNTREFEELGYKYNVEIQAVSIEAAGEKNLDSALSCCGFSDDQMNVAEQSDLLKVESLSDYGVFATLWNKNGNNIETLMKDAHKEANLINMLFGFYMDREENRIGNDGWDFISGNIGFK